MASPPPAQSPPRSIAPLPQRLPPNAQAPAAGPPSKPTAAEAFRTAATRGRLLFWAHSRMLFFYSKDMEFAPINMWGNVGSSPFSVMTIPRIGVAYRLAVPAHNLASYEYPTDPAETETRLNITWGWARPGPSSVVADAIKTMAQRDGIGAMTRSPAVLPGTASDFGDTLCAVFTDMLQRATDLSLSRTERTDPLSVLLCEQGGKVSMNIMMLSHYLPSSPNLNGMENDLVAETRRLHRAGMDVRLALSGLAEGAGWEITTSPGTVVLVDGETRLAMRIDGDTVVRVPNTSPTVAAPKAVAASAPAPAPSPSPVAAAIRAPGSAPPIEDAEPSRADSPDALTDSLAATRLDSVPAAPAQPPTAPEREPSPEPMFGEAWVEALLNGKLLYLAYYAQWEAHLMQRGYSMLSKNPNSYSVKFGAQPQIMIDTSATGPVAHAHLLAFLRAPDGETTERLEWGWMSPHATPPSLALKTLGIQAGFGSAMDSGFHHEQELEDALWAYCYIFTDILRRGGLAGPILFIPTEDGMWIVLAELDTRLDMEDVGEIIMRTLRLRRWENTGGVKAFVTLGEAARWGVERVDNIVRLVDGRSEMLVTFDDEENVVSAEWERSDGTMVVL